MYREVLEMKVQILELGEIVEMIEFNFVQFVEEEMEVQGNWKIQLSLWG